MDFDDFALISTYTRQQAIDDGVLVDVSVQARETGILLPTVLTAHLRKVLEGIPAESCGQDYRERPHDVLWMTFLKLKSFGARKVSEVRFPVEVRVIIDGKTQQLWIAVDGDGLTIMYPEDYWPDVLGGRYPRTESVGFLMLRRDDRPGHDDHPGHAGNPDRDDDPNDGRARCVRGLHPSNRQKTARHRGEAQPNAHLRKAAESNIRYATYSDLRPDTNTLPPRRKPARVWRGPR